VWAVTISATTDLPGNISTITMSGFNGGSAPTGALKLSDESGGQGNNLMFAAVLGGEAGYGNWDDVNKVLTMQVIETLECGGEYLFSFVLTNQNHGQSQAPSIMISATNLHLYLPLTRVLESPMDPDETGLPVPRSSPGDAAPLLIWNPVFTVLSVEQSTSGTCVDNTISVALKSSVPLFAVCEPVLTLSGLTHSDSPSEQRRNVDHYVNCTSLNGSAGVFDQTKNCTYANFTELGLKIENGASSPFEKLGDWHQGSGTLKIRVTSDSIETDVLSFSFTLRNPARGNVPDPNGVKVEVTQGIVFSQYTMVLPAGRDVADYPLTVHIAKFTMTAIGQSSAWPCDDNTITLSLLSNVTLVKFCSPTATISGMVNMLTQSTKNLTVTNYNANNAAINASWDQSAGTLEIDLTKFGDAVTHFNFSFVLRNPQFARAAIPVHLTSTIVSANDTSVRHSTTGQNEGDTMLLQHLNASDAPIQEYHNLFELHNVSWVKCPANCSNASSCNTSTSVDNCTICPLDCRSYDPPSAPIFPSVVAGKAEGQPGRRKPEDDNMGFVRKIFFETKNIAQSGAIDTNLATDPCSNIIITVSLVISVPLLAFCPTNITISGLRSGRNDSTFSDYQATPYFIDAFPVSVSTTTHTPNVTTPEEGTGSLAYVRGSWSSANGSWIMSVDADTVAGRVYSIAFPLRQRAQHSPMGVQLMTIKTGGKPGGTGIVATGPEDNSDVTTHNLELPSTSSEHRPLKVNQLKFARAYISQSSPFPCDNNTLAVTITVRDDAVYKSCRVNVTITGLTGSQTPDLIMAIDGSTPSSTFAGNWQRIPGSLVFGLPFANNESWRKDWALSFVLVNPRAEQSEVAPTIEANLVDDFEQMEQFEGSSSTMIRDTRQFSKQWYICGVSQDPAFVAAEAALQARPYLANCSDNDTFFNTTNNQTTNCTHVQVTLPPNPTPTPVHQWGHLDGFLQVPSTEEGGNDQFLCGEFASDRAIEALRLGLPGDRMPLKVRTMSFITKDIGQSTPYPCALNTLTVTIETDVPLLVNTMYAGLECMPTVTIKGLLGSQTVSSEALAVILNGNGKFASSAAWTQNVGDVELTVLANTVAAEQYLLSFNLTNKATPSTQSGALKILSSINQVEQSMVRDGAALTHVFETMAGNAQPLHIIAAGFTVKNVGQSVPYPGTFVGVCMYVCMYVCTCKLSDQQTL